MFDFDEVIERRGSHSGKWDSLAPRFDVTAPDAVAMAVAEMDFRAPPCVNDAIRAAAEHGIHGYFSNDVPLKAAVTGWMARRHGWDVDPAWVSTAPGLVAAIGLCLQAFTETGDDIVVFSPVYHSFGNIVRATGRRLHECEMDIVQGRHEINLERLAQEIGPKARMVLLCSPHNPGGRVWTPEELRAVAAFCAERDLILVSDEIHHDLVFDDNVHTPTALAAPDVANRLVTLVAPSKTFNIAGGDVGFVVISDPELRKGYRAAAAASNVTTPNRIGAFMATSAYTDGGPWFDALLPYLQANRDFVDRAVAERLPGVRSMPLQGTYLSWLDFSGTGLGEAEVAERLYHRAHVVPHKGSTFGKGGEGWWRLNFACPRPVLARAMDKIVETFAG